MQRAILTDFLAALSQRELYLEDMQKEDLAGIMRLDVLMFGRILIPDSHLFDGCLLLDTFGPTELADVCGHTEESRTIEVRLRSPSFDDALTAYLMDPASRRLRPIEFRYLRDDVKERMLAERLDGGVEVPEGGRPYTELVRQMREIGVSEETVSSMNSALGNWRTDGARLGLYGVWPRRPFPLVRTMDESPVPGSAFNTSTGRDAYAAVLHTTQKEKDTRSASFDRILRRHFSDVADESAALDELTIRDWYHDCRQLAIARQHECILATRPSAIRYLVPAMLGERDMQVETVTDDVATTEAVRRIVYVLGGLTAKEFRELLEQTAVPRRVWLSTRRGAALRDLIAVSFDKLTPARPKVDKPWYQQEKVILPTATTVAGMLVSGPTAAVAAGFITVGLGAAAARLGDVLTRRGDVRSLVRWATEAQPAR